MLYCDDVTLEEYDDSYCDSCMFCMVYPEE